MTRILLARHGVSEGNLAGRFQGHQDIPISPQGEEQARRLAHRLQDEPITTIYTSDLQRAWRTAEIVAEGHPIPIIRQPRWREFFMGGYEGLTVEEAAARFPTDWAARLADWANVPPPGGGESRVQGQLRAIDNLAAIRAQHPNGTVLVITHGGLLSTIYAWLYDLSPGSRELIASDNCSLSCIEWDDARPTAAFWNDVSHLQH